MELLARGDRRVDVWMATAGNDSARDANVSVFALAHPRPILDHFGDRGYRLIQLAAGMFAGRLQLAAQAVDLGASAMTAVDGMVTGMFGSRAAESMFLIGVAFGHHRRKDARRTNAFLDRGRDVPAG